MRRLLVVTLLLAAWPGTVSAQLSPSAPPARNYTDARSRRALRERAAARLGTQAARAFVEAPYGDDACYAVFACSLPVARKLAECHASGELDKLHKPRELLRVIARHGNEAALFAVRHLQPLQDPDAMDAFLAQPLEIALGLKPLEAAAGELRAYHARVKPPSVAGPNWRVLGVLAGTASVIALLIWRKRRLASA